MGRRDTPRVGGDEALAQLVTELGVDGLFLDVHEGGHQLVEAMRRLDPPPVLEESLECRWIESAITR